MLYPDMEIIQFENGKALLSYTDRIDILFLDIQMGSPNGIEAARELRKANNNVTIIFVTAIEEYVFQAFDVKAFHYLVKPIDRAKFYEVLKGAIEDRRRMNAADMTEKASLVIKKGTVTQKIFLCEIIYLEVFNRKVIIHKIDGDVEFYGKLTALEDRLSDDFVRCHRAFIVNMRYVMKYDAGSITLENGAKVLLSKQKYADFVRRYLRYTSRLIGN